MHILIIGGYGNFGKRLTLSLARYHEHQITIAGRSAKKALQLQAEIKNTLGKSIDFSILDIHKDYLAGKFLEIKPDIVVNTAGPYQLYADNKANYKVAKACIAYGCHYVDLADNRYFVGAFHQQLHHEALAKKLMLVAGASTVPGLSAAVLDKFIGEFSRLEKLYYGISPGNKTERGEATISAILAYCGKPFSMRLEGIDQTVYGWQDLRRYDFGQPLGKRWMSNCDIPDLDLFTERYPDLKTIRFQAGLEVSLLHIGLWLLSGLTRIGIVTSWQKYTHILTRLSEYFMPLGTDSGGMFIEMEGIDYQGAKKNITWQLIADKGYGPNVPAISAELLINRIAEGNPVYGAMPCVGLFNLEDFFTIAQRWGIYQRNINSGGD